MEAALLQKWIEKEKRAASLSKRRYLHFDRRINFAANLDSLIDRLSNKDKMATHSFYPFVNTIIETPRYKTKLDTDGKRTKKIEIKARPIAYASHFDALIYSWYSTILTSEYESQLEQWGIKDAVLAYLETGKSNINFAFETFNHIFGKDKCVALAVDISSFFDNLDHEILKHNWQKTIKVDRLPADHYNVFNSLTNYTTVSKNALDEIFAYRLPASRYCKPEEFRTLIRRGKLIQKNPNQNSIEGSSRFAKPCGIPQGSPISAVLSNIYMIDFDQQMRQFALENLALYKRYCDDIIVVCKPGDLDNCLEKIKSLALQNQLTINPSKTEIIYFSSDSQHLRGYADSSLSRFKNLQYLGFEFNGTNIYIRPSSISRYQRRLASEIRECLKAANGNKAISNVVFKRRLLKRFTSKGRRNFISYAIRSANDIMKSPAIRRQYSRSMDKVLKSFACKQAKFNEKLKAKGLQVKAKR